MDNAREVVNAIGQSLQAVCPNGSDLIVNVGVHAPSADCTHGHTSVTLRRGVDEITTEAVGLYDALFMAETRMTAMLKKREDDKAKPASVMSARSGETEGLDPQDASAATAQPADAQPQSEV